MKVYKFYSPTCGPCKVLEKNLQESGIQYENIDITDDTNEELISKYGVASIPTLIAVDDADNEIIRQRGILKVEDIINYFG